MRVLLVVLQIFIGYLAFAILLGMMRSSVFNVLEVAVVGTFLAGLLLITVLVPRLTGGAQMSPVRSKRVVAGILLSLLALGMGALAQGVLVGVWRGPARLVAVYQLSVQFAGTWALALVFFLVGGLCIAYATKALWRAEA